MFTGIICGTAKVLPSDRAHSLHLSSHLFFERKPPLGASIAIDGVCLTVARIIDSHNVLSFDLGHETMQQTLLGQKKADDHVNIEFSLRPIDTMDGHFVQGHVDGLATLVTKTSQGNSVVMEFACSPELAPLIVPKGSIAINGVSLTVNEAQPTRFSVCLVPVTLAMTTLGAWTPGMSVHIETDIIGRYVQHLNRFSMSSPAFKNEGQPHVC